MKSFNQYHTIFLNEAFNRPYKWKVKKKDEDHYIATFKTEDGTKYDFDAEYEPNDELSYWTVEFSAEGFIGQRGTDRPGRGMDAFRIFATIKEIFEKWAREYNPEHIEFAAAKGNRGNKKDARAKIYDRFVKSFSKQNGYTYTKREREDSFWFELNLKKKKATKK